MTGYKVKGRPLLRYSTRGNTRLQALNKGLEERLGGKTLLAEQKGWTSLLRCLYTNSWKRSSMSPIFISSVKWVEIQPEGTRICIAPIIRIRGIPQSSAGHSRITWNSWSKQGFWGSMWSAKKGYSRTSVRKPRKGNVTSPWHYWSYTHCINRD